MAEHLRSWPRPYASRESTERCQLRKLQRLLAGPAQRTPYYRRRFGCAGFRPGQLRTLDDFRRIPISTKKDFQTERFEDRMSGPWILNGKRRFVVALPSES